MVYNIIERGGGGFKLFNHDKMHNSVFYRKSNVSSIASAFAIHLDVSVCLYLKRQHFNSILGAQLHQIIPIKSLHRHSQI